MKNMESKKHPEDSHIKELETAIIQYFKGFAVKATIKGPDNKTFVMYFPTKQDLKNFETFIEDGIENTKKKVLEKAITGKEFAHKALEKSKKWGRGREPTFSIYHTHLWNMLNEPNVKVLVEEEK